MTRTGCDILASQACIHLRGKSVGLLSNPASVTGGLRHIITILEENDIDIACLFGPQHGFRGETQANMIEWEGYTDPRLGIPVYSLYSETRRPTKSMLEKIDTVVIDLPDVGARPYTYLWTSVLMMEACAEAGVDVMVLDRPNPLGGAAVEGPLLNPEYRSFVGMFPLPMRHGMTMAELLSMINGSGSTMCRLEIVKMRRWKRSSFFDETELPWVLPSPNIPTPATALVYPGTVLLEGTNISEGRGTTHPFEIVGAPWIEPESFARELNGSGIEGVVMRPLFFKPSWDKYANELCGGIELHVTNRKAFRPVRCAVSIISAAARIYRGKFEWSPPPYEYEETLMPVDIIYGGPGLRETIETEGDIEPLFRSWRDDEEKFSAERRRFLFYR